MQVQKLKDTLLKSGIVLLTGSIIINAWLAKTIVSVQRQRAKYRVVIGSELPPVDLADWNGKRVTLGYSPDTLPSVIYWFGPNCVWCKRNAKRVADLELAVRGTYRFFWIANSRESLAEYLAQSGHVAPIYTDPTGKLPALYGLDGTPFTLVLSAEGRVLKAWSGAYVGEVASQVEEFFRVRLGSVAGETDANNCATCAVALRTTGDASGQQ